MQKSLSTFSSNGMKFLKSLLRYRALFLGIALFIAAQFFFLFYADVAQVGSKQVVKEKRTWARTGSFIQKREGAKIVLFMGNSRMASGVIPGVFDKENGRKTRSYNLSLIGLQMSPHYFMMRDYLKHHDPPDYVFIDPSSGGFQVESFPSYAIQGAGLSEVIKYAYYRRNIDVLLNYIIPSRIHWPEVTRYFLGKLIQSSPKYLRDKHRAIYMGRFSGESAYEHNRKYFYESQYVDPHGTMKRSLDLLRENRGYYFIVEQSSENGSLVKEDIKRWFPNEFKRYFNDENLLNAPKETCESKRIEEGDEKVALPIFFEKFFDLMREYNIKVALTQSYILDVFKSEDCVPDEWRELKKRYDNVFILEDLVREQGYEYKYFSDPGHLNRRGAVEYTKRVAQAFRLLQKELEGLNE